MNKDQAATFEKEAPKPGLFDVTPTSKTYDKYEVLTPAVVDEISELLSTKKEDGSSKSHIITIMARAFSKEVDPEYLLQNTKVCGEELISQVSDWWISGASIHLVLKVRSCLHIHFSWDGPSFSFLQKIGGRFIQEKARINKTTDEVDGESFFKMPQLIEDVVGPDDQNVTASIIPGFTNCKGAGVDKYASILLHGKKKEILILKACNMASQEARDYSIEHVLKHLFKENVSVTLSWTGDVVGSIDELVTALDEQLSAIRWSMKGLDGENFLPQAA